MITASQLFRLASMRVKQMLLDPAFELQYQRIEVIEPAILDRPVIREVLAVESAFAQVQLDHGLLARGEAAKVHWTIGVVLGPRSALERRLWGATPARIVELLIRCAEVAKEALLAKGDWVVFTKKVWSNRGVIRQPGDTAKVTGCWVSPGGTQYVHLDWELPEPGYFFDVPASAVRKL